MAAIRSLIGHLDADCFYVSAERVRFPSLRHRPVGVLGNQGACVIAKSYEMKACGVTTGIPIWDARPLCPDAVYVKRDFAWYEVLSRRILDLTREVSPLVEYYSVDELFFDASLLPRTFGGSLQESARALQQRILRETGIPVSIGISRSRTLAKLASDSSKPFGCAVVADVRAINRLLKERPVEDITGIGGRLGERLRAEGIATCDALAAADRHRVRKLLTKTGEELWWELRGVALRPLRPLRPPHKVVVRGGSIGAASADPVRVRAWTVRNAERLAEALEGLRLLTDRLGFHLSFKEGGHWYGRSELTGPTAEVAEIAEEAKALLARGWQPGRRVWAMHIIAERLHRMETAQASLFSGTRSPRSAILKLVNSRHGRFALRSAETLPLTDIYFDRATDQDICDIGGKMCF